MIFKYVQVCFDFFMLNFTIRIIAKKIIFYLMSINNSIYVFWSGFFSLESLKTLHIIRKWYKRKCIFRVLMNLNDTKDIPRYLYCSTHPSFLSILASSIFIGLQRRSIWIDVRNEILLGSFKSSLIFLKHQHSKNRKVARIVNINFSVLLLFINHYLNHSYRTNWYYTSERCKKVLIC